MIVTTLLVMLSLVGMTLVGVWVHHTFPVFKKPHHALLLGATLVMALIIAWFGNPEGFGEEFIFGTYAMLYVIVVCGWTGITFHNHLTGKS